LPECNASNEGPKVSVIMPVYNTAKFLRESIESILSQTFSDFEFIIIDDASTDESVAIIRSYPDKRIKLIQKSVNTGYTESLNMAIDLAKGKYIARMDSDDISLNNRFEKQYRYMEENPEVLVLGGSYQIVGTNDIVSLPLTHQETAVVCLMHVPVAHPTVFIRKKLFDQHNIRYEKKYEPAEDYGLWTKVVQLGRVENLPDVVLFYRHHSEQESKTKIKKLINAAFEIRGEQLARLVNFDGKSYSLSIAVEILTGELVDVTGNYVNDVRELLVDILKSNRKKNIYEKDVMFRYLRGAWLKYISRVNSPDASIFKLILPIQFFKLTRLGYKSFFYLLSRPISKVLK
jgi:glycosyltransferase involved in cell wall biosynthesis